MRRDPEHHIARAQVAFDGGSVLDVQLLDSSGTGARVEWRLRYGPCPEVESHLVLIVQMADSEQQHRIHALVARQDRQGDRLVLGLDFCDPGRDLAELRPLDRRFFDRRQYPRHRLDEDCWVDLALGPIRLCGSLHDLSMGGLAMRLAPQLAGAVTIGDRGVLHLRLPGDFQDLTIEAELRNRQDRPDGTRLGLKFLDMESDWSERIEDFLAELQARRSD